MELPEQPAEPTLTDVKVTAAQMVAIDAAISSLGERAFLHGDPSAYRAGVRDALEAVNAHLDQGTGPVEPES